ncbi:MAG: hypothetical protein Tsb0014_47600 [Pleurocapsa sp.]
MVTWICDGRARNSKYYQDSHPHEPHENTGLDCEICGLPREAMDAADTEIIEVPNSDEGKKLPFKAIIGGIVVLLLGIAGYFLVVNLGDRCDAGMEKVAGECIDPYLETYNQAVTTGEKAEQLIDNYRTPQELEQAQQYLTSAIAQLRSIPDDAPIFSEAIEKINLYENRSREVVRVIDNFQLCAIEPKPDYCRF